MQNIIKAKSGNKFSKERRHRSPIMAQQLVTKKIWLLKIYAALLQKKIWQPFVLL